MNPKRTIQTADERRSTPMARTLTCSAEGAEKSPAAHLRFVAPANVIQAVSASIGVQRVAT